MKLNPCISIILSLRSMIACIRPLFLWWVLLEEISNHIVSINPFQDEERIIEKNLLRRIKVRNTKSTKNRQSHTRNLPRELAHAILGIRTVSQRTKQRNTQHRIAQNNRVVLIGAQSVACLLCARLGLLGFLLSLGFRELCFALNAVGLGVGFDFLLFVGAGDRGDVRGVDVNERGGGGGVVDF
jgi:hypothetical protein